MAVRRSVLQELGGFSPRLGKLRGTLLSGEDHELCQRIQTAGFGARYVPSARVTHWVPAKRMRLTYFLGWFYWSGITHAVIEEHGATARPGMGVPMHLLRTFLAGAGSSAVAAVAGRFPAAVDRLLDSAFAAGYAAGRLGLAGGPPVAAPEVARSV
jgi:hypothetical protein